MASAAPRRNLPRAAHRESSGLVGGCKPIGELETHGNACGEDHGATPGPTHEQEERSPKRDGDRETCVTKAKLAGGGAEPAGETAPALVASVASVASAAVVAAAAADPSLSFAARSGKKRKRTVNAAGRQSTQRVVEFESTAEDCGAKAEGCKVSIEEEMCGICWTSVLVTDLCLLMGERACKKCIAHTVESFSEFRHHYRMAFGEE